MSAKKSELIQQVVGEAFPLFVGNVYKLLKNEFEEGEDISKLTKSLIERFWLLTAEKILGLPSIDEDDDTPVPIVGKAEQEKIEEYALQAMKLYDELQHLTKSQIQQAHADRINAYIVRRKTKLRELGKKHDEEAFFNDIEAQADWEYWNLKIVWTPDEAVALSFGKDPRTVNQDTLLDLKPLAGSPFRDEYFNRLDDLNRCIDAKVIKSPMQKAAVSKWARSVNISLPDAMAGRHVSPHAAEIQGNKLHKFYGIILGLAIKHYGYNILGLSNDAQTAVARKIKMDLVEVGSIISDKSLVRYLREARTWVHSEISHPLIVDARKKAEADERRSAAAERQKP